MTSDGLEAAAFFETPLIIDSVPDAFALNADLRAAITARRTQHAGLHISNVLGWHSDTRMLEWGGAAALRLVEHVIGLADQFTLDIAATADPRYVWVPEIWANVSGHRASNQFHSHPGAYWSAVYYVDDGYGGSPDRSLGGELILEDPRMPMTMMQAPDLRILNGTGAFYEYEQLIRPSAGRLLMFPAWLRHGVRPYFGKGERISVAINITARPAHFVH